MRGVGFDDDGASGGEGRGGVSAGDGKREGEVAGAEDGDGAERAQHGANVGTRERLAIGECGIDAGLDPGAFFDDTGEHAELVGGAVDFAGEAGHGQRGFKMCALGEFFAMGFEAVGDAAEEGGAGFAAGLRVACEGFGGERGGALQFLRAWPSERPAGGARRFGERRPGSRRHRASRVRADEGESGEFHNQFELSARVQESGVGSGSAEFARISA